MHSNALITCCIYTTRDEPEPSFFLCLKLYFPRLQLTFHLRITKDLITLYPHPESEHPQGILVDNTRTYSQLKTAQPESDVNLILCRILISIRYPYHLSTKLSTETSVQDLKQWRQGELRSEMRIRILPFLYTMCSIINSLFVYWALGRSFAPSPESKDKFRSHMEIVMIEERNRMDYKKN